MDLPCLWVLGVQLLLQGRLSCREWPQEPKSPLHKKFSVSALSGATTGLHCSEQRNLFEYIVTPSLPPSLAFDSLLVCDSICPSSVVHRPLSRFGNTRQSWADRLMSQYFEALIDESNSIEADTAHSVEASRAPLRGSLPIGDEPPTASARL